MKITDLFIPSYGTKLDLNKMTVVDGSDRNGINFVSRSSKNLGIVTKVKRLSNKEPHPAGLITVTLGGTYLLSSFVQPEPFYTAQNIMVLTPKQEMSFQEKIFYCICIAKNRFRYVSHGREANRTLKNLKIPSKIPDWVNSFNIPKLHNISDSILKNKTKLTDRKWKYFRYGGDLLFSIKKGSNVMVRTIVSDGKTQLISAVKSNNGLSGFVNIEPQYNGNVIAVIGNGNAGVGEAFYQPVPFCATTDVNILKPKFELNEFIAMFLVALIRKERFRYSFGRKWLTDRMSKSTIKLPVNEKGEPDWQFMENYIKSLPYSINLQN